MSESRVRENRMHGSMRRREATTASRASTRRAAAEASRRPYNVHLVKLARMMGGGVGEALGD
jgi:hypothetical protein